MIVNEVGPFKISFFRFSSMYTMHTDSIYIYISFSISMDPSLASSGTLFFQFASLTHHF